jgi:hypothetical protein
MTNSLQNLFSRIFGGKSKSSPAVPDQRPNKQEYLKERQRKLLDESVLDARRFDPPPGG